MPLKRPPLVEVWMSFRFEPATGAPPWTRERYAEFLKTISDTHPNVEEMTRRAIRIAASKRGGTARIKDAVEQVLAMRAISEDGQRTVQLAPDELMVDYLRGAADSYPGFRALLDEAISHCRRYAECFHTVGILDASLHHVDVVDVPRPKGQTVRSEEYFTLDFRIPHDVFGHFVAFDLKAVVQPPQGVEQVQLVFATTPRPAEEEYLQFRLEWHTGTHNAARMTEQEVRTNLQAAHDRLEKCFRRAFTEKGWALFEPEES